jgi:DnaJ-class molecular chaperone
MFDHCKTCGGSGWVEIAGSDGNYRRWPCSACNGTGSERERKERKQSRDDLRSRIGDDEGW